MDHNSAVIKGKNRKKLLHRSTDADWLHEQVRVYLAILAERHKLSLEFYPRDVVPLRPTLYGRTHRGRFIASDAKLGSSRFLVKSATRLEIRDSKPILNSSVEVDIAIRYPLPELQDYLDEASGIYTVQCSVDENYEINIGNLRKVLRMVALALTKSDLERQESHLAIIPPMHRLHLTWYADGWNSRAAPRHRVQNVLQALVNKDGEAYHSSGTASHSAHRAGVKYMGNMSRRMLALTRV